jgi:hypothetical protein
MYKYENTHEENINEEKYIETNILKPKFYLETMKLIQRGEIDTQQKGLEFLYNHKNENEQESDFYNFLDSLEILKFIEPYLNNEILIKSNIEDLIKDFKNEYFLREDKFNKYISRFYDYEDFENMVNEIFKIKKDEEFEADSLKDFLFKKLIEFKLIFENENHKKIELKREHFSLDKKNLEEYSRIKNIFNVLKSKNVSESVYKTDFKLFLAGLSKNILNTYSNKIEDISSDNLKEQILKISETSQNVSILFDDIKQGFNISEHKMYSKIEPYINNKTSKKEIELLHPLMGKSIDSKGLDFYIRLYDKLRFVDETLINEDKIKIKRSIWSKSNLESSKTNNNINFRHELREQIINLIKNSPIKSNIQNYSKSFIFDKLQFPNIPEFSYPEELKNNPYNISIQGDILKDVNINIQILLIILESSENNGEVYEFYNKDFKNNMEKLYKKTNISKDFLQKSLMDIVNYDISLSSKYEEINQKINNKEEINIKKEISYEKMNPKFNDYSQFVNTIKSIYNLNKVHLINDNEILMKKISIFNNNIDIKSLLKKFPLSNICDIKNLTHKEIEKISNLKLSIVNYYEDKQINDLLLEQKMLNMNKHLNYE